MRPLRTLYVNHADGKYAISVQKGALKYVGELFNLRRRVLILTDEGVPTEYSEAVASASQNSRIVKVPSGEGSKSFCFYEKILTEMLDFGMTRTDALVSVGGGVVGDLGGFCAASYMRGIDFYNVPTTLLSQLDSSIGGKTAINLGSVKNIIGAFHQPNGVLIDPDVLKTLPKRQIANGLAEAIKMAATSDSRLFERLENEGFSDDNAEEIIYSALSIKKAVVEEDEREGGIRKILNFGHTLGHGIEACCELQGLFHGECVALGMVPVIAKSERNRLVSLCARVGLPMNYEYDLDRALSFISHDKKCSGEMLSAIFCDKIGSFRIEKMKICAFENLVRQALKS